MQQTTVTKTRKATPPTGEMVTRKKLTASESLLNIGDEVTGYFLEMKEVDQMNPETGEERKQIKVFMETTRGGDRFFLWGNAGLKTAIIDSCLNAGDHITIQRLEKKSLKGGRTKNQYDIFQILD